MENSSVQILTGTTLILDTTKGVNSQILPIGNTVIKMINLVSGQNGFIVIHNPTEVYTLKFIGEGYEIFEHNSLKSMNGIFELSGNNKKDIIQWNFENGRLYIYGFMNYINTSIKDEILPYIKAYYVSNSGNDLNDGLTESTALKTITKINSLVLSPGEAVLFKRGESFEGEINLQQSGNETERITIGAYGTGNKPKIYGSSKITEWSLHSGNIYKAKCSDINQVFLNDEKLKVARTPNTGYHYISEVVSTTKFKSQTLPKGINYAGAIIWIRTYYWTTQTIKILSSREVNGVVELTLSTAPRFPLRLKLGFIVMGKLEFLDQPGEWFYDGSEVFISVNPQNLIVRGSMYKYGVNLSYRDYITIQDLNLLQQKDNSIYASGKNRDITVNRVDSNYPDKYGIKGDLADTNWIIKNSFFRGMNHYGIYLRTNNTLIEDNQFYDILSFDGVGLSGNGADREGGAIFISDELGNNIIRYNKFRKIGYNGIQFAGPKTLIEYNFINEALCVKDDGGGIYTSWYNRTTPNGSKGSVIRNNILMNCFGDNASNFSTRNQGEGIYIDEQSADITIENNFIYNCGNSAIKLHKCENITVQNNICLDSRSGIMILKRSGTIKSNIVNNQIIATGKIYSSLEPKHQSMIYYAGDANADFSNNKYRNGFRATELFLSAWDAYYSFAAWKSFIKGDSDSTANVTPLRDNESIYFRYNEMKKSVLYRVTGINVRDIKGNAVSDFVLEPFTAKVLIGENIIITAV